MSNDITPLVQSLVRKKMVDSPESCFYERDEILFRLDQILGEKTLDPQRMENFVNCPTSWLVAIRSILKCFNVYDRYDRIIQTQLQELKELRQLITHFNARFGMGDVLRRNQSVNVTYNCLFGYFEGKLKKRKKKKKDRRRRIKEEPREEEATEPIDLIVTVE